MTTTFEQYTTKTHNVSTITPDILLECFGPIGQEGSLSVLRERFGKWRPTSFSGVWWIHDRVNTGFTYRVFDWDAAFYSGTSFEEFKQAFKLKEGKALVAMAANAIYFRQNEEDKYLGVSILRMLNR